MKHIGFLSFGHWTPSPQSQTRSASDALLQSTDLAVAVGGAWGGWDRMHHFARLLASPFPLLAAWGAPRRQAEFICGRGSAHSPVEIHFAVSRCRATKPAGSRFPLRRRARRVPEREHAMLGWALTFLIVALIAAALGFGGIAGTAVGIAKIIFFVAIVLFLISAIAGAMRGRSI